jgi:cystathionine beta-lyase
MGFVGALAAYGPECDRWLKELLAYLRGNRDFLAEFVCRELPEFAVTVPEATYLAWMDCRDENGVAVEMPNMQHATRNTEHATARFGGLSPFEFFLREAKVAFSDGATFGKAGEGFVRINFACPRSRLEEALAKVKRSLKAAR